MDSAAPSSGHQPRGSLHVDATQRALYALGLPHARTSAWQLFEPSEPGGAALFTAAGDIARVDPRRRHIHAHALEHFHGVT